MPDKPTQILFHRVVNNNGLFGIGAGFMEQKIKEIQDANGDIVFRINSPGGSVFDGWAMIQHIKEAKQKGSFDMIVDGMAASMGGFFLAFGDNVKISQLGRVMLHKAFNPWLDEEDTDGIKLLKSINEDLHNGFKNSIEKRGKDPGFLDEIFSIDEDNMIKELRGNGKDFWFDADSAVEFGLADEKIEDNELKIAASNLDYQKEYYNFYNTKREVITMADEKKKGLLSGIFNKDDNSETFIKNLGEMFEQATTKIQEQITTGLNAISESVKSFDERFDFNEKNQAIIISAIGVNQTETNTKIEKVEASQDEILSRLEAAEVKTEALEKENKELRSALELVGSNGEVVIHENDNTPKTKAQEKKELTNDLISEVHAHSGNQIQN